MVTTDGEELGTVVDIFRVGESEVYVVRGARGETLVPAVADVVKEIDLDRRSASSSTALRWACDDERRDDEPKDDALMRAAVIDVVTIFPELFPGPLGAQHPGSRARARPG